MQRGQKAGAISTSVTHGSGVTRLGCEGMFPCQAAQKSSLSVFLQLPALTSPLPQQPQQRKLLPVTSRTAMQIAKLWSGRSSASPERRNLARLDCPQLTPGKATAVPSKLSRESHSVHLTVWVQAWAQAWVLMLV